MFWFAHGTSLHMRNASLMTKTGQKAFLHAHAHVMSGCPVRMPTKHACVHASCMNADIYTRASNVMEFPCACARTRAFIFLGHTLLDHGVLLLLVGLENRVNQPVRVC